MQGIFCRGSKKKSRRLYLVICWFLPKVKFWREFVWTNSLQIQFLIHFKEFLKQFHSFPKNLFFAQFRILGVPNCEGSIWEKFRYTINEDFNFLIEYIHQAGVTCFLPVDDLEQQVFSKVKWKRFSSSFPFGYCLSIGHPETAQLIKNCNFFLRVFLSPRISTCERSEQYFTPTQFIFFCVPIGIGTTEEKYKFWSEKKNH